MTAASQGPKAKMAPLCSYVLEGNKLPLEEFQQGREIGPNCTHRVFFLHTTLTGGNTASVTHSPWLSKVLLIHDLLILPVVGSQQKREQSQEKNADPRLQFLSPGCDYTDV